MPIILEVVDLNNVHCCLLSHKSSDVRHPTLSIRCKALQEVPDGPRRTQKLLGERPDICVKLLKDCTQAVRIHPSCDWCTSLMSHAVKYPAQGLPSWVLPMVMRLCTWVSFPQHIFQKPWVRSCRLRRNQCCALHMNKQPRAAATRFLKTERADSLLAMECMARWTHGNICQHRRTTRQLHT